MSLETVNVNPLVLGIHPSYGFTDGPWDCDPGALPIQVCAGERVICTIEDDSSEEAASNARLIKAGPAMYQALDGTLSEASDGQRNVDHLARLVAVTTSPDAFVRAWNEDPTAMAVCIDRVRVLAEQGQAALALTKDRL